MHKPYTKLASTVYRGVSMVNIYEAVGAQLKPVKKELTEIKTKLDAISTSIDDLTSRIEEIEKILKKKVKVT